MTIIGKQARKGQFNAQVIGPTDESYSDPDAIQKDFSQQRGFKRDAFGKETGDIRNLQSNGVLTEPITGPSSISEKGDPQGVGSSFYGDDE